MNHQERWQKLCQDMNNLEATEPDAPEVDERERDWEEFCRLFKAPPRLKDAKLEHSSMMPEKRVQMALKWLESPSASLYIYGDTGCGKTYFIWGLMRQLLRKRHLFMVRVERGKNLEERILADLANHKTAEFFLDQLRDVPYLFIDEFGEEKSTERVQRDYLDILDHRVEWEKPTIITTNLAPKHLTSRFGARIASRIKTFVKLPFGGIDLREQLCKGLHI